MQPESVSEAWEVPMGPTLADRLVAARTRLIGDVVELDIVQFMLVTYKKEDAQ